MLLPTNVGKGMAKVECAMGLSSRNFKRCFGYKLSLNYPYLKRIISTILKNHGNSQVGNLSYFLCEKK